MVNSTNQQRIKHLEQEMAQLEERMMMNQTVLETKHTDLEKSVSLILETQLKIQEGLNQILTGNVTPQPRSSILGSPPIA